MSDRCYHCDLVIPENSNFNCDLSGRLENFCCAGCMAVANTISSCGLQDFYKFRDAKLIQPEIADRVDSHFAYLDDPSFVHPALYQKDGVSYISINLTGLTCAACVWLIEKYLAGIDGIKFVAVNQVSQKARIGFNPAEIKPSQIMSAIQRLGYRGSLDRGVERGKLIKLERQKALKRLGVAGIGMMQVGMYSIALYFGDAQGISDLQRDLMRHTELILSTLVVFYSARTFFAGAWSALRMKALVMDVPVSIAIFGAYGASLWATFRGSGEVYFDSVVMFTFFLLLSRFLENQARANLEILPLDSLIPDIATLCDIEGKPLKEIATSQLKLEVLLLIKPGQRVPADITIISGESSVDESVLSGEFTPVLRGPGEELVAGSLNGDGRLIGRVLRLGDESALAGIERLYEDALARRTRAQQLTDRWAGVFIGVVLVSASLTFVGWYFVDSHKAFGVMLSVLVVSCPCALSLAMPTSVAAAMFSLRQKGLLVRHPAILDQVRQTTDVIFDKTGTLTEGRAEIAKIQVLGELSEQQCLQLAGALESVSTHPFARAFPAGNPRILDAVRVIPGRGVEAVWQKRQLRIGNSEFAGVAVNLDLTEHESQLFSPIYLSLESQPLAVFLIQDSLHTSARDAVSALQSMGLRVHLLSGDPSTQPAEIARQLNISQWENGMSAKAKLDYINALKLSGCRTLFVGDGINDVPSMGSTEVSMVVAQAPDIVQARADIGMIVSDLRLIPLLFRHSHKLSRVIRQNIGWAIFYNLSAMPAAALGLVVPWLAALGMSASSVVVVFNAMRLRKIKLSRS